KSRLAHTQCPVRPFIGANRTTSLRPHDSINGAIVVTRPCQPALQLRNRGSIGVAVTVSRVAVGIIIVPIQPLLPIRIITVIKRVRNAPAPRGVPIPVVRITKPVPIRRIIPIRIIAVVKRVRNTPAPRGVPIPVVRITKSADEDESVTAAPVVAAPVTAAPVVATPVAPAPVAATPVAAAPVTAAPFAAVPITVCSRFAAAEGRPVSAEFVSASRRYRAKLSAILYA